MADRQDIWKVVIGGFIAVIVVCALAAGAGLLAAGAAAAYGAYALASAAGAGKGLSIAAGALGLVAGPVVAVKAWKAHRKSKRAREETTYRSPYRPAPASPPPPPPRRPAPKPPVILQPVPEAGIPPVLSEALETLKAMDPEERIKCLDKLRDAFPNDIETLGKYNDQMALSKPATAMKPLMLVPGKKSMTP